MNGGFGIVREIQRLGTRVDKAQGQIRWIAMQCKRLYDETKGFTCDSQRLEGLEANQVAIPQLVG